MPADIATLTAAPRTIQLGGRPVRIAPLTLADIGELQAWIDARLPDPIKVANRLAQGMPEAVQQRILDRAFDHVMTARPTHRIGSEEADGLLASMAGFVQVLALMCRPNHPELTPEAVAPLVGGLDKDELGDLYLFAFGIRRARPEPAEAAPAPEAEGDPGPKAGAVGTVGTNGAAPPEVMTIAASS